MLNLMIERKKLKLNQTELAEKLGIKRSAINRYENGHAYPSIDILLKMSELFGVSVDYLIKKED